MPTRATEWSRVCEGGGAVGFRAVAGAWIPARRDVLLQPRERKAEHGPLPGDGIRPDASAVALEDPAGRSQTDAGTFEFVLPVQPLEQAEQLRRIPHVEADAVVAHE